MEDSLGNNLPVDHAERGAEKPAENNEHHLLRKRHGRRCEPDVAHGAAECPVDRAEYPLLRVDQLEQVPRKSTEKADRCPYGDGEILPQHPNEEQNSEAKTFR